MLQVIANQGMGVLAASFSTARPAPEILHRVLRAGQGVCGANGARVQRLYVIEGGSLLRQLAKCTGRLCAAPVAVLVGCDCSGDVDDGVFEGMCAVIVRMARRALEEGLACNVSRDVRGVRTVFALPPDVAPLAVVYLGYSVFLEPGARRRCECEDPDVRAAWADREPWPTRTGWPALSARAGGTCRPQRGALKGTSGPAGENA